MYWYVQVCDIEYFQSLVRAATCYIQWVEIRKYLSVVCIGVLFMGSFHKFIISVVVASSESLSLSLSAGNTITTV